MPDHLPILDPQSASGDVVAPEEARRKLQELMASLGPLVRDGVLVAFSGGVDSAFLLWAARRSDPEAGNGRVVALTTTSPSTPSRDQADARAFTRELDIPHLWRQSLEGNLPEYARNDRERCYHCKVELFRIAGQVAQEQGVKWVLYGYNHSDRGDVRPGHRAAGEAGALSPLADAGLTKPEIRFLLREAGLTIAEKAASPCLSSRITTGIPVTPERLADVQAMEHILDRAEIPVYRVRICRDGAGAFFLRVEVSPDCFEKVLACRDELVETGSELGYRWVTLDLAGYRTGGGVS